MDELPVLPADRVSVIGWAGSETEALIAFADWYNDKTPPHLDLLGCEEIVFSRADLEPDQEVTGELAKALAIGRAYRVGFLDNRP